MAWNRFLFAFIRQSSVYGLSRLGLPVWNTASLVGCQKGATYVCTQRTPARSSPKRGVVNRYSVWLRSDSLVRFDTTSLPRTMDELSSVSHMFEEGDDYASHSKVVRNRLNLLQRIEVIKRYGEMPHIHVLSQEFKCGRRQIKNILRKRKKYLTMWTRNKHRYSEEDLVQNPSSPPPWTSVCYVLHEWVKRARCYQINITDEILRSFGQEIADHIKVDDFKPTDSWLDSFKEKYDLANMRLNIKQEKGTRPEERKPLSISLIIADLRKEKRILPAPAGDFDVDQLRAVDRNLDREEARASRRSFASESSDSGMQLDNEDLSQAVENNRGFAREINTYREALNRLGPLEQFVLFKENVRAVGLINQLENLFREEMAKSENC